MFTFLQILLKTISCKSDALKNHNLNPQLKKIIIQVFVVLVHFKQVCAQCFHKHPPSLHLLCYGQDVQVNYAVLRSLLFDCVDVWETFMPFLEQNGFHMNYSILLKLVCHGLHLHVNYAFPLIFDVNIFQALKKKIPHKRKMPTLTMEQKQTMFMQKCRKTTAIQTEMEEMERT